MTRQKAAATTANLGILTPATVHVPTAPRHLPGLFRAFPMRARRHSYTTVLAMACAVCGGETGVLFCTQCGSRVNAQPVLPVDAPRSGEDGDPIDASPMWFVEGVAADMHAGDEPGVHEAGDVGKSSQRRSNRWPLIAAGAVLSLVAYFQHQILTADKPVPWVPAPTSPTVYTAALPSFPQAPRPLMQSAPLIEPYRAVLEIVCGDLRAPAVLVSADMGADASTVVTRSDGVASCAQDQLMVTDGQSRIAAKLVKVDKQLGLSLLAVPLPLDGMNIRAESTLPDGTYKAADSAGVLHEVRITSGRPDPQLEPGTAIVDGDAIIGFVGRDALVASSSLCGQFFTC